MINKWRMIVLGLVFSQGAYIVAMDKKTESPRTPRRNPLSCSAEARNEGELIKRTAALKISVEIRKEEKQKLSGLCYEYCGGRSLSPQDLSPGLPYGSDGSGFYGSDCP